MTFSTWWESLWCNLRLIMKISHFAFVDLVGLTTILRNLTKFSLKNLNLTATENCISFYLNMKSTFIMYYIRCVVSICMQKFL